MRFMVGQTALAAILVLGTLSTISACTPTQTVADTTQTEDLFRPAHIKDVTNGVADWQIEYFDNFDQWIPTFQDRTRDEKTGWIKGAFYKGLADWAAETNNAGYYAFLKNKAEEVDYAFGPRDYHADDHVVGQYYLVLYDKYKDADMLTPMREVFDRVIANPSDVSLEFEPKSDEKGYYKQCLKRWCWADALFMAPPVLTELTKVAGDPIYLEFSDKEFWVTYDYLYDQNSDLFLRDSRYFTEREEDGTKVFWSRGNGWVFAGLTDVLDALPVDHPSRPRYEQLYKEMAAALVPLQAENGFWPISLEAGHLYPVKESSGTAFFVAGLSWGISNGMLDAEDYLPTVEKGWAALNDAVVDTGMIGWVQQVGFAPDKVSANETQFYGAGAFLLAGSAVLDLAEKGIIN